VEKDRIRFGLVNIQSKQLKNLVEKNKLKNNICCCNSFGMLSAKQNFNQLFFFWTTTKPCLGVQTNGHGTILIDKACLTPQVLLERKDTLRKLSLNFECRTNALLNRKQKTVTILCFQL